MKLDDVGEVIADRNFKVVREGREVGEIVVLMGRPTKFTDHDDYYCPYQIKGFAKTKVMAIAGIDAFQALQLALSTIGVELDVLRRDSKVELLWDGNSDGDLGFPAPSWSGEKE